MTYKVMDLDIIHPLDCPVVAQVRFDCADYPWFYDRGYIRYYDGTKVMLREHQRVALIAYGVRDGYHVHHIDHNRLNNAADNLAVLSPTEHLRLHASQQRSERVVVVCPICSKSFETTAQRFFNRNHSYCSNPCREFSQRLVTRPSKEYLAQMIADVGNWLELGRIFGVSDNAVRKWARGYELI